MMGQTTIVKDKGWCQEKLCPLCHAAPGWQGQILKEPGTCWHWAAWSHLYCRDTIVVLLRHSARQCCLLCGLWRHRRVVHHTVLTAILLCPHVTTDKANKRENRYFLLLGLAGCFAFFVPPPPPSSSSVSFSQVGTVFKDQWGQRQQRVSTVTGQWLAQEQLN